MLRDRKAIILDLEGVLFAGTEVLPGARETLAAIEARGLRRRFLTNISNRSAADVAAHLAGIGLPIEAAEIICVTDYAGAILRKHFPGRRVMLVGSDVLRGLLRAEGFEIRDGAGEEEADLVVVARDDRFTYESLSRAAEAVARGAHFVAMNEDTRAPKEGGGFGLGGRAIAAAVEAAAGRPPAIIGKAAPYLFEEALAQLGAAPGEALMVGGQPADRHRGRPGGRDGDGLDQPLGAREG